VTTITIRHVPEDVRNELASRAARSGQSLQEYMLGEVVGLASRPSIADWVARVRERKRHGTSQVTSDTILDALSADRR